MATRSKSTQHNQLMWLAILVMALLLIPFLLGMIQKRSFDLGFAQGIEKADTVEIKY